MNKCIIRWSLICGIICGIIALGMVAIGFPAMDIVVTMLGAGMIWSMGLYAIGTAEWMSSEMRG